MKKNIYTLVAVIIFVLAVTSFSIYIYISNKGKIENLNKVVDKFLRAEGNAMIYIDGDETICSNCALHKYELEYLVENNALSFYYINVKDLSLGSRNRIFKRLGYDKDLTLPATIIYKDKKPSVSIEGLTGIDRLYTLLKKYDLINDNKLPLNYLNLIGTNELLDRSGISLLAFGNYEDENNANFEKNLWSLNKEYNLNISFMFLIDVIEAEGKQLEARMFPDSDMKVNAPVLYIIGNGKVLNYIDGTASSTEIVEFLKNNGIINN
jgi:hypothetical protein